MTKNVGKRIKTEDIGDAIVVTFMDQKIFDEQQIDDMGDQLFSLVNKVVRRKIILSFSGVDYLSSVAMRKFITLQKKLTACGGTLALCGTDPGVYEVFEITRLNEFFMIFKDQTEALAYLA